MGRLRDAWHAFRGYAAAQDSRASSWAASGGSATDCEYEVAWANTYAVRMDYTSTADRAGNAVINRHRAPASRLLRVLEAVPNLRAAAFRQSGTEIGVEKLATLATSTTAATTLAGLCFNGLDGIAATARGLLLDANRGLAFVVDTSSAKEFALAHWLVGGVDGGRLFVRVFDDAAKAGGGASDENDHGRAPFSLAQAVVQAGSRRIPLMPCHVGS